MAKQRKKEDIIAKIHSEGLQYWLENYFDPDECKKAGFPKEFIDNCVQMCRLLSDINEFIPDE